jgi:hypothetical protein
MESMITDPVAILEKIVEENGDCEEWAGPPSCKKCPLGGKRVDGRRLSCMDYLDQLYGIHQKTQDEVKAIYKRAAEEELFTIQLEELLE